MARQNSLRPTPGATHSHKRVGRGNGSGHGNFSGRGMKGQKSRSGYKMSPGFEGGQLPLIRRMPRKRGFTNNFRQEYAVVNLGSLNIFAPGTEVGREQLIEAGLVRSRTYPVKVLAGGEISRPLNIKAARFSAAARAKIEAAGGQAEEGEIAPAAG